jgi:hypothetical protein
MKINIKISLQWFSILAGQSSLRKRWKNNKVIYPETFVSFSLAMFTCPQLDA